MQVELLLLVQKTEQGERQAGQREQHGRGQEDAVEAVVLSGLRGRW